MSLPWKGNRNLMMPRRAHLPTLQVKDAWTSTGSSRLRPRGSGKAQIPNLIKIPHPRGHDSESSMSQLQGRTNMLEDVRACMIAPYCGDAPFLQRPEIAPDPPPAQVKAQKRTIKEKKKDQQTKRCAHKCSLLDKPVDAD